MTIIRAVYPMSDEERTAVSLRCTQPSWLGGAPTSLQIIIKRRRIPVRSPHWYDDVDNTLIRMMQEWINDGGEKWMEARWNGGIEYVCH